MPKGLTAAANSHVLLHQVQGNPSGLVICGTLQVNSTGLSRQALCSSS